MRLGEIRITLMPFSKSSLMRLVSSILDVAKVMKKNEVHKFVNHKLVNFVFIYDFQAIKINFSIEILAR